MMLQRNRRLVLVLCAGVVAALGAGIHWAMAVILD
jgi:hypothetical protein